MPVRARALAGVCAVLLAGGVLVPAFPAAAAVDPPRALPESATANDKKWQPALDFDTDSCYNVAAIGPDGTISQGLPYKDVGASSDCRDQSDLDNTNVYARQRCNSGWCVYLYDYYFEKDVATPNCDCSAGHTHDWEHIAVWVQNDQAKWVSASAHGEYDVRMADDILWEETHPKIVYHKSAGSTHAFRFASANDEPPENHYHNWRVAPLVSYNGFPDGLRDSLFGHSFGSATIAIKDATFAGNLARARPYSSLCDPENPGCGERQPVFPFDEGRDENSPGNPNPQKPGSPSADPSVIRVGNTYYSVESFGGAIWSRTASSNAGLLTATPKMIWRDPGLGAIWAPELVKLDGRYYVYFSARPDDGHRMYVISSASPDTGYGTEQKLNLPEDRWAIDGTAFTYDNQLWFTWSGWAEKVNDEQNIYIARMSDPTTPTGARYLISQPREPWERVAATDTPLINEAPEPIKDPNGQLHITYSANGSWGENYCIGDLRLKAGGDPTYVWDWYKSNGCLMGSNRGAMLGTWPVNQSINGPGHHSFVLLDGDIDTSPPAGQKFPLMYHGVPKGTTYNWENRRWQAGAFGFYPNITYGRANVPGDNMNTGYSLGFFEDPNGALPPAPTTGAPGQTSIRNQDPSVIRVDSTYYSVESDGTNIYSRSAPDWTALQNAPRKLIWSRPWNMPNLWAPDLVKLNNGTFVVYFASGGGAGSSTQRMYYTFSNSPDSGYSDPKQLSLPDNRFAVDGTAFYFGGKQWFVWSGWEGDSNDEQNIYLAEMSGPFDVTGPRKIISQAREPWERVAGGNGYPYINEAPQPLKDPSGQLHIVYSANGSWSDQYCLADLRLKAGGDPMYVWDWYKSNGCLFGSNQTNMMPGWDATLYVDGPGHNSFVLLDGDINTSPPAGPKFPLYFHAVPKGTQYDWNNRLWFHGTFCWWGDTNYHRDNVPGDNDNQGWSLKFFE
ncbi:family 43 glycosylhydrolase [Virgisporangium aurantiacum]|nr:family 43 glycosylhydrolase [Virgisporangium aurantiacum]